MVFKTIINWAKGYSHPPAMKFWRVHQYLRFSGHFRGRKRNCYRIGIRYVNKALMRSTLNRKMWKQYTTKIWNTRLDGACAEHGLGGKEFMEGLVRCDIQLDRKVLQDMAIYEPRTFQSLVEISKKKLEQEGLASAQMPKPDGVITRGML